MSESTNEAYGISKGELKSFVERLENLAQEKKEISDQEKEVKAEAKAAGFDVKVLAKIISLRKRDPDDISHEDAVLQTYMTALGM